MGKHLHSRDVGSGRLRVAYKVHEDHADTFPWTIIAERDQSSGVRASRPSQYDHAGMGQ